MTKIIKKLKTILTSGRNKRILSSIIAISLLLSIFPASSVFAANEPTISIGVELQGEMINGATTVPALDAVTGEQLKNSKGDLLTEKQFTYVQGTATAASTFDVLVGTADILDAAGLVKTYESATLGTVALTAGACVGNITSIAKTAADGSVYFQADLAGLLFDDMTGTAQYTVFETSATNGLAKSIDGLVYDFVKPADATEVRQEQILQGTRQQAVIRTPVIKGVFAWDPLYRYGADFANTPAAATGSIFGVYTEQDLIVDGRKIVARDTLIDVLVVDDSGMVNSDQALPFENYYLLELNVTEGLFMVDDPNIQYAVACLQSADDAAAQTALVNYFACAEPFPWLGGIYINAIWGKLELHVIDAATGMEVPYCTFEIYDAAGLLVDKVFNNDDEPYGSTFYLTTYMPYGEYSIVQTIAPQGMALCAPKTANITFQNNSSKYLAHVVEISLETTAVETPTPTPTEAPTTPTVSLGVEVRGEVVTSAKIVPAIDVDTGEPITNMDGEPLTTTEFTYAYGTSQYTSDFYACVGETDILDADGNVKSYTTSDGEIVLLTAYSEIGSVFSTVAKTAADGSIYYQANLDGLPYDDITGTAQYTMYEYNAPEGFCYIDAPLTYNFTYAPEDGNTVNRQEQVLESIRQRAVILMPVEEHLTVDNFWDYHPAEDIVLGVYAKYDIYANGQIIVPKDALVDVMKTNSEGRGETTQYIPFNDYGGLGQTTQDIPFGSYYVVVLSVTPNLVFPESIDNRIQIKCMQNSSGWYDEYSEIAYYIGYNAYPLHLSNIWGNFLIDLNDEDTGARVTGATFEIYNSNGTLVDTVSERWSPDYDSNSLIYGKYTIKQTTAGTDGVMHNPIDAFITRGLIYESVQQIVLFPLFQATININLLSEEDQLPMSGAIIGVYNSINDDLITQITTDESGNGSALVDKGNYYLKVTKTADGFALSEKSIDVA